MESVTPRQGTCVLVAANEADAFRVKERGLVHEDASVFLVGDLYQDGLRVAGITATTNALMVPGHTRDLRYWARAWLRCNYGAGPFQLEVID